MKKNRRPSFFSTGLTLVEMLVALLIGVILMLALVSLFNQSTRQTAQLEARGYVAEAGRYALDLLAQDVRQAGSWGCLGTDFDMTDAALTFPERYWNHGVKVFHPSVAASWNHLPEIVRQVAVADQSLLFISGARDTGVRLTGRNHGRLTGQAQVWKGFLTGLNPGNTLLLVNSQCEDGIVLHLDQFTSGDEDEEDSLQVDLPEDEWPEWLGQTIGQDQINQDRGSQVYRIESRLYFIGEHAGSRWLMRWQAGAAQVEPLVEGIEQLFFLLGQKKSQRLASYIYEQYTEDSPITSWTEADWQQVGALQVNLLVAAPQVIAGVNHSPIVFRPNSPAVSLPGREASVYRMTTALRGRLAR
ncbi:PilW family protein [Marinospirillum sp. MEB164]|uniref:PilW family protein n=1 Tax=Marinospirillum alkalitolerans TaxID=3123374 RepID=A0ABW8PUZ7_9GAMM